MPPRPLLEPAKVIPDVMVAVLIDPFEEKQLVMFYSERYEYFFIL